MIRIAFASVRSLALSVLLVGGAVPAAEAATIGRDALERRLLDACVYRQFQVKAIERATLVDKCRCATRTAMKGMDGDRFDEPRSGGLTGAQDLAIRQGIAACFPQKG